MSEQERLWGPGGERESEASPTAGAEGGLSYAEAVEELETILARIEGAEVDVDVLSANVERAAELLRLCRSRIHKAELRIRNVLEGLEAEPGDGTQGPSASE